MYSCKTTLVNLSKIQTDNVQYKILAVNHMNPVNTYLQN